MSVPISNTFGVKLAKPIDDRFVAADISSRNALLFKYPGLIVYVEATDTSYELKADLTTWVPLGLYTLEDILDSDNDAGGNPIINAGDAVNPQDLLTLKQGKELAGGRAVIYTPDLLESNPIDVSTVTSNTFLFDGVQLLTKAVFLAAQVDPLENGYWAWVGGVFFKMPITDPIYTFLTAVITPKLGVSNAETLWIVDQLNNNIDPDLISFTWRQIGGSSLGFTPENIANKGIAGGYASLDGSGLVPSAQLPSYVDDVLEFANLAAFPVTGESGKIYIALDTNFQYRWSGSVYVQITSASAVWGAISGSLASQTDLQTALNARLLIADIINVLTDTSTNKALSAAQGKALKDTADALATTVAGKQATLTSANFATFINSTTDKTAPVDADIVPIVDVSTGKRFSLSNLWANYILPKIQAVTTTIAGLWTFSGGITISGGRLLFTNTFTAGGDSWYRQASNVLRAAINGTDRIELNTSGVRTKGTHTFENTIYTNLTPTVKKIGTIQTSGELTTDYTPTSFYQGIQRTLQTLVSSTTETAIFNPEIGSTLIPSTQFFLGSQWLYTIPFKLSTTGTVRFIVRFGEAATGLTSRTILADTGTFSPSVTAQGGVLKVFFTVATLGASGTANLVCNIEVQINGKNPVFTVPLRTTNNVSTLVDNLLEITCLFGTNSASDRIDVENANCLKLS